MSKLEKIKQNNSKFYWYIIVLGISFFILRIPSLIEPYWYGDEGVYAAVSNQLLNGDTLYTDVWDHKPPGIYILYTILGYISRLFSLDYLFIIRLTNMFLGGFAVLIGIWIARLFRGESFAKVIGILLVLLIGTPYLEGNILNAENIFIVFTALAYLIFYKYTYQNYNFSLKISLLIGLLFGLALYLKMQPLFEILGLLLLTIAIGLHKKISLIKISQYVFVILFFAAMPMLLTKTYYITQGASNDFIFANFTYNISYASDNYSEVSLTLFAKFFILSLITVGGLVLFSIKQINQKFLFIFIWAVCAIWGTFLSSRGYAHYLLQLVIPLSIFILTTFHSLVRNDGKFYKHKKAIQLLLSAIIILILIMFYQIGKGRSDYIISKKDYYYHAYDYLFTGNKDEFNSLFGRSESKTNELSKLVEKYGRSIWIWENSSWYICKNNLKWPTRYLVNFHVDNSNAAEIVKNLQEKKVSIIIINKSTRAMPQAISDFIKDDYIYLATYNNYEVYEYVNRNDDAGQP